MHEPFRENMYLHTTRTYAIVPTLASSSIIKKHPFRVAFYRLPPLRKTNQQLAATFMLEKHNLNATKLVHPSTHHQTTITACFTYCSSVLYTTA